MVTIQLNTGTLSYRGLRIQMNSCETVLLRRLYRLSLVIVTLPFLGQATGQLRDNLLRYVNSVYFTTLFDPLHLRV